MSAEKRKRGRPVGTGLDDTPVLIRMADLMVANPVLKPTTAIKRLVPLAGEAQVRRLQIKWRAGSAELMEEARRRATSGEPGTNPLRRTRRRGASLAHLPNLARALRDAHESVALKAMREMLDSSTMRAARELYDTTAMQAARELQNSTAMQAMRELQNSTAMQAMRELQNSTAMQAMRELQDSPAMRVMREQREIWDRVAGRIYNGD
jgi:hypothetical protein